MTDEKSKKEKLQELVYYMFEQAGLPAPKIVFKKSKKPTIGIKPSFSPKTKPSTLYISEYIFDKIDFDNLDVIIAHEIGHILSDTPSYLKIPINIIVLYLESLIVRYLIDKNLSCALILALFFVIVDVLFFLKFMRKQEFEADRKGAELFELWDKFDLVLREQMIKTVLDNEDEKEEKRSCDLGIAGLFRTHPTFKDRIENLHQAKQDKN